MGKYTILLYFKGTFLALENEYRTPDISEISHFQREKVDTQEKDTEGKQGKENVKNRLADNSATPSHINIRINIHKAHETFHAVISSIILKFQGIIKNLTMKGRKLEFLKFKKIDKINTSF